MANLCCIFCQWTTRFDQHQTQLNIAKKEKTRGDLAADISHASSLTESDVYAVLQSLVREIPRNIAQGNIVRLGNLGSFRLGVHSTGSDEREDVSEHNIYNKRIIFHAGKLVKKELDKIIFEKNKL